MAYRRCASWRRRTWWSPAWVAENGAPRREYRPTCQGRAAPAEWGSIMRGRGRLIDEFLARNARLGRGKGG